MEGAGEKLRYSVGGRYRSGPACPDRRRQITRCLLADSASSSGTQTPLSRRYQSKHHKILTGPHPHSPAYQTQPAQSRTLHAPGPSRRMATPLINAPIQGAPHRGPRCMLAAAARRPGSRARCMTGCALPHLKAEGGVRSAGSRGSLWSGNPLPPTGRGLTLRRSSVSGQEVPRRSVWEAIVARFQPPGSIHCDDAGPAGPYYPTAPNYTQRSIEWTKAIEYPPTTFTRLPPPEPFPSTIGPHRYKHAGVCVSDAHATTLPHREAPCSAAPSASGFGRGPRKHRRRGPH